jgi:hypothetical protein
MGKIYVQIIFKNRKGSGVGSGSGIGSEKNHSGSTTLSTGGLLLLVQQAR